MMNTYSIQNFLSLLFTRKIFKYMIGNSYHNHKLHFICLSLLSFISSPYFLPLISFWKCSVFSWFSDDYRRNQLVDCVANGDKDGENDGDIADDVLKPAIDAS